MTAAHAGSAYAQCYGSLALVPSYFEYDYLVRICVHFGDESSLPEDVVCCRGRLPGENRIEVPIFIYNAHEGVQSLQFAVDSNDSIESFSPQGCFYIHHQSFHKVYEDPDYFRMNLKLKGCMGV